MKVATVRFTWTKSPSTDIVKREFILDINGAGQQVTEIGTSVEEFVVDINAPSGGSFTTRLTDEEGNVTMSVTQSFTIPDLEAPLPDTNLAYTIVAVHDV